MPQPRFVVCGDNPLAHRLVDELISRYDAQVTVILPARDQNHGPQLNALPGVRIVEASRLDAEAFGRAKLHRASGLALVAQDDAGNIHAALRAQELNPGIRLVVRMFNMRLGHGVRRLFHDCAVLSDASIAAPELVSAALGESAPNFVRLPGRTLYVTRRGDVPPEDVVCGIAMTAHHRQPELLPADDDTASLVLAVANQRSEPARAPHADRFWSGAPKATEPRPRWRARARLVAVARGLLRHIDRRLEIAGLVLLAVFLAGVVAVGLIDRVAPWEALYTTLLIAVGAGDPDLQLSAARQAVQVILALVGLALIPVVTATVVDTLVNARLVAAIGQLQQPLSGHVVVIGLGNVGRRVVRMLRELGHSVVAIDNHESTRGAQLAHELEVPVVIGDATEEQTLRDASVGTCHALLALTSTDVANLEAALNAQLLQPGLRVVLRLFDSDFATRVEQAFDIPISRSVSALAAPAFAAALLERDVIGTIAVQRQVLMIAEVPVATGSELAGERVTDVAQSGQVRVVALTPDQDSRPVWTPPPDTEISPGDRLTVIANRTGLSHVLTRSNPDSHDRGD